MFDKRGQYLLLRDYADWNEYNDDGTVKYYDKYMDKQGNVTWVEQATGLIVFKE